MTRIILKLERVKKAGIISWKSYAGLEDKAGSRKGAFLLFWLLGSIMVFALLYSVSHIALLSLPKHEGINVRSQLAADYNAWEDLEFQPVDPGIIEEIQLERDLPDQLIINDPNWSTPVPSIPSPFTTQITESPATPEHPSSAPTEPQPPVTLTPVPTDTVLQPQSTATAPVHQPRPTKTRKPHKTPKPPKPEKTPGPGLE